MSNPVDTFKRLRKQYGDVFIAIETLCKHIEAYRNDEISICWSNGITLRVNGVMQAGGMPNVSKWILENSKSVPGVADVQSAGETE